MYNWVKRDNGETVRDCHLSNLGLEDNDQYNDWYIRSFTGGYEIPGLSGIISFLEGTPRDTPMVVCGDYDADGVCATVIMVRLLRAMGYSDVSFSIPRRFTDGYGLNDRMIDGIIAAHEPGVIVTVDNGITALYSIARAKDAGWTVIVTDHHVPIKEDGGYTLPVADMLCDPAIHGIPYYCGAGIAYKIAEQILGIAAAAPLLPYAAIATVADAVELREEGHVFARRGIQIINNKIMDSPLADLVEKGVGHDITAEDIAFRVAPLLNAVGRLHDDGGERMAEFLLGEGSLTVDEIIGINDERKTLSDDACERADRSAITVGGKLMISLIKAHPGVIGIAAGRLASENNMPAAVFYVDNDSGMIHGSARSVPGVDICDIFECCWKKGIITSFGGHAGAAGINMESGMWNDLIHGLDEILMGVEIPAPDMTRYYDLDIMFDEDTVDKIIRTDAVYAPYGKGNDSLVFRIREYPVPFFRKMGGDGMFITGSVRAVSFSDGERLLDEVRGRNKVDIYGRLSLNTYRGKTAPQIEILDIA